MTRAEKKLVLAWTHAQARHFAQSMEWTRAEWTFIGPGQDEKAMGLYDVILFDVRAPRYLPTEVERDKMERTREHLQVNISCGRIAKLNVVNLP
jgi:hypothetical protein